MLQCTYVMNARIAYSAKLRLGKNRKNNVGLSPTLVLAALVPGLGNRHQGKQANKKKGKASCSASYDGKRRQV